MEGRGCRGQSTGTAAVKPYPPIQPQDARPLGGSASVRISLLQSQLRAHTQTDETKH